MNFVVLMFVLAALLLFGGAVWLFLQARERDTDADLKLRLRVSGVDEVAVGQGSAVIKNRFLRAICHLFWRTGSDIRPDAVVRLMLIVAAVALVSTLTIGPVYTLPLLGVFLLSFYIVLVQQSVWRRRKIVEQLPSYLENVIRVLAAGNTLDEALSQAAREAPNPIQPLFISISRQVRLGEVGGDERVRGVAPQQLLRRRHDELRLAAQQRLGVQLADIGPAALTAAHHAQHRQPAHRLAH